MRKQQQQRGPVQLQNLPSRETLTIEQKLGQLQAPFRAMPIPGSGEYRFSLSATRYFAQEVVVKLVAWLHDTDTSATPHGRQRQ